MKRSRRLYGIIFEEKILDIWSRMEKEKLSLLISPEANQKLDELIRNSNTNVSDICVNEVVIDKSAQGSTVNQFIAIAKGPLSELSDKEIMDLKARDYLNRS
jgi:hypothetical protein